MGFASMFERRRIVRKPFRQQSRIGIWAAFRADGRHVERRSVSVRRLARLCPGICMAVVLAVAAFFGGTHAKGSETAWTRHTIDNSSRGADGVRPFDVNGDGRLDLVTPWEEGGRVRAYLNPGREAVADSWPAVTVGSVGSPEDAVFVDLDADGAVDVVSCCEGNTRTMFVHWAPVDRLRFLEASAWTTEAIPASEQKRQWMYCLPVQIDGRRGVDLLAGAKGPDAQIGWFEAPAAPRKLADWKWHPICKAGWVMSLETVDVDGDGDLDVLASDRRGAGRGCYWLENAGAAVADEKSWRKHLIGGNDREVMFMRSADVDRDGQLDIVCAVSRGPLLFLRGLPGRSPRWATHSIPMPEGTGTGKAVHVGDIDLDGQQDIVFTCESAKHKSGVVWLSQPSDQPIEEARWASHEISGTDEGVKFDLIQLIDIDEDGDLDVLTCEERDNLGVIWYENPAR